MAVDISVSPNATSGVKVAVIVPVYKHSVYAADAIMSAVNQVFNGDYRVVVVDDGCPHRETQSICLALSTLYPEKVSAIRKKNAGLSAARNSGVDYALSRWPEVEAFYFLDADNIISPHTLQNAYSLLKTTPGAGWVYPDIVMFGSSRGFGDYSGSYSVLRHLIANVSEAGSLISRSVVDAGCRFDEGMRQGFEDWEFWWQCIDAGFVGVHLANFGFYYRKRPESMLSESERVSESVLSYMKQKHRKLLSPRSLIQLEAAEFSRYAVMTESGIQLCMDPRRRSGEIQFKDLLDAFLRARAAPWTALRPGFVISSSNAANDLLEKLQIDRFVFLWLTNNQSEECFSAVEIRYVDRLMGLSVCEMPDDYWPMTNGGIHVFSGSPKLVDVCVDDPEDTWLLSLSSEKPEPRTRVLKIEVGSDLCEHVYLPNVVYQWLHWFKQLHARRSVKSLDGPTFKSNYLPSNDEVPSAAARIWDTGSLFPICVDKVRDICFILPIVAFGGVEKVALRIAQQFQSAGWRCHLLVLSQKAQIDDEWLQTFDSVSFHFDPQMYGSSSTSYLGSNYPEWGSGESAKAVEGYLLPMTAVINFHAAAMNTLAAKLRRSGVVVCASMHVNDRTAFGREVGHNFLTIGYEHVFDVLAPCSLSMAGFIHAMGVPLDKIVPIPNAPGYNMSKAEVDRAVKARDFSDRPLNVLFIGRFDRQKGLDRLLSTIRLIGADQTDIRWRLVGKAVIDENDALVPQVIQDLAEPPVQDPHELTELYCWADVLFMPSHWEGLPLTILEAQRVGCIPLVSNVGAVAEAIEDGQTGLLIPDMTTNDFAVEAAACLGRLKSDRTLRERLSRNAARSFDRSWSGSAKAFIQRVEEIVLSRSL